MTEKRALYPITICHADRCQITDAYRSVGWVAIRPAVFKFLKQHREKRLVNSEDLETPVVRKAWVALPCTGY
jgi:hypothetical protein